MFLNMFLRQLEIVFNKNRMKRCWPRLLLVFCLLPCLAVAQDPSTGFVAPSRKMQTAFFAVNSFYVEGVDNDALAAAAMKALVEKLDPHSAYMTKEELDEMNEPLQGEFDGIGISFNMMNDTLYIVEVIAGGPSEKVGVLAGDRIIHVDGETIAGVKMSNKEVMKRLKGPKGTTVNVRILRRGEPDLLDFRIVRDKIPVNSIDASFMVDKSVGYILINRFGATTADEFREAVQRLKSQGMKSLIVDLQSNGGGYMSAAIELADEFLSEGKCIVYTEGKNSPKAQAESTSAGGFEKGNLIILIDEYSASSSEILTGAVQDWDRGLVIGRRSFGKGLVQRVFPLGDGTALKLTVSRYHTPSGRCIQKPYDEGDEAYQMDLVNRYKRGEMLNADSIHFADSLLFKTLVKHRDVYGGGGIMPDVFVPADTSRFTPLHRLLVQRGILNRFCLQYLDVHRSELASSYPDIQKFIASFEVDEDIISQMLSLAQKEKVQIADSLLNADQTMLKLQTKAYLARDLFKTEDYYRVMMGENDPLQEALRILSDRKLRLQYGLQ